MRTIPGRPARPGVAPGRLPAPNRRPLLALAAALAAVAWWTAGAAAQGGAAPDARAEGPIYDLVIRGGRVLDGGGNPWIDADVAIRDGRIVRVGAVRGAGRREIDAAGLYVAPGFIDMMDQSGSILRRHGRAENKLLQGVTTAIAGEGGTPVPVDSIGAYFEGLEREGISLNFGTYYSQAQARQAVMGPVDREPTPAELGGMRDRMRRAMEAGAFGMTTALIYPPGSYADTDELVEVAGAAAEYGGLYASHIRGEGKDLLEAVAEAIEIGERAGMPVEIFHFKAAYAPGWGELIPAAAALIDSARARGVEVAADLYPYTAGGTGLEATIPSWAHAGGADSLLARLADPETRARLRREIETGSPGWWNIVEASGGWENIVLVNARDSANARWEGMSLAEIAAAEGTDPADAAFDLVAEGDGRVMAIYHMMDEADVATALRLPWTSVGSDAAAAAEPGAPDALGLPHPRSYGTFARILARYVRDRGVLSLEEAVRKMTSWPAARMRLEDRGMVQEGFWADVVVFDLDAIRDRATYRSPYETAEGFRWVVVNGEVVVEEGRHTGRRPGRVLRGPGWLAGR